MNRWDGRVRSALEALVRRIKRDPAYRLHPDTATAPARSNGSCARLSMWAGGGQDGGHAGVELALVEHGEGVAPVP